MLLACSLFGPLSQNSTAIFEQPKPHGESPTHIIWFTVPVDLRVGDIPAQIPDNQEKKPLGTSSSQPFKSSQIRAQTSQGRD